MERLKDREKAFKEIHTDITCTSPKGFHLGAEELHHKRLHSITSMVLMVHVILLSSGIGVAIGQ